MSKHSNLRLTAKLLPIIAPFIAKGDIRYYLNAINVRPHKDGGAVICATNGHALGAIYDADATCEHEVILRFDARIQQACAAGLATNRSIVMIGERLGVIEEGGSEVYIQAGRPDIEADYPRYERVIPKLDALKPGLLGTFAAPLIALAEKAALAAGKMKKIGRRSSGLHFFNVNGDCNGSAVLRIADVPAFVGVLMPMRDEACRDALPEWVAGLNVADDLASMTKAAAIEERDEVPA